MPEVVRLSRLYRKRTTPSGVGDGLLPALTAADFTYLGAWLVPYPSVPAIANSAYGLALKYEPSDLTEPLHFITGAADLGTGRAGFGGWVYEFRNFAPENPAVPTDPDNYTQDTGFPVKEYGNVYGTVDDLNTYKRLNIQVGSIGQFAHGGTFPRTGVYWDPIANILWSAYCESYSGSGLNEELSWHICMSELNYSTGGSTAHGPWRMTSPKYKSGATGFTAVPSAFLSATGMDSAQRLAVGFGGGLSLQASGDCSFGPTLTAFDVPTTATAEQTTRSSTPLIGYFPTTGSQTTNDRANRPTGYDFENSLATFDSWGIDKWCAPDAAYLYGTWIHGANKAGFVTIGALAGGMVGYVNATHGWEYALPVISITSETDMAAVVAGASPDSIQPVSTILNLPAIDLTSGIWALSTTYGGTISSITSVAGQRCSTFNATVTMTVAHGLVDANWISIRGTDHDAAYRSIWEVQVVDTTTFKIRNLSMDGSTWDGVTATGGTIRGVNQQAINFSRGLAFDDQTNTLYFMFVHPEGDVMIAAYSVDC